MSFTVRIQANKENSPDDVAVVAVYQGHELISEMTRLLSPSQYVDIQLEEGQNIVVRKHRDPIFGEKE